MNLNSDTSLIKIPGNRDTPVIKAACTVPHIRIVYILTPKMKTPLYEGHA